MYVCVCCDDGIGAIDVHTRAVFVWGLEFSPFVEDARVGASRLSLELGA